MSKKEITEITVNSEVVAKTAYNQAIIDEYYSNGFNGSKAVRTVSGKESINSKQVFNNIFKDPANLPYINSKKQSLSRKADIKNLQIVKELINFAYVDATEFINLSPEQVKNLPTDIKRSIQSFEHKKHTYTDRNDTAHTEEIIKIKLVDKLKAIEMINKHIGFYQADNKQKANNINLNRLDINTLNNIYQAITTTETPK
jgi:phage terminase small subunit